MSCLASSCRGCGTHRIFMAAPARLSLLLASLLFGLLLRLRSFAVCRRDGMLGSAGSRRSSASLALRVWTLAAISARTWSRIARCRILRRRSWRRPFARAAFFDLHFLDLTSTSQFFQPKDLRLTCQIFLLKDFRF